MNRPTDEQLRDALGHLAFEAGDRSLCPYYAGRGDRLCFDMGVCANPNEPEPHCITDVPSEGWPLEAHPVVREWLLDSTYPPNQEPGFTPPPAGEF